ncbi:hypothetical protein A8M77_02205 [Variovorax sp. JS1663]|nr:hypothetical protein A8M77_02205 [Variovorax sp. JS1663]
MLTGPGVDQTKTLFVRSTDAEERLEGPRIDGRKCASNIHQEVLLVRFSYIRDRSHSDGGARPIERVFVSGATHELVVRKIRHAAEVEFGPRPFRNELSWRARQQVSYCVNGVRVEAMVLKVRLRLCVHMKAPWPIQFGCSVAMQRRQVVPRRSV